MKAAIRFVMAAYSTPNALRPTTVGDAGTGYTRRPLRSNRLTNFTAIAFFRRPTVIRTIDRQRFTSFVTPAGVRVSCLCSCAADAVSEMASNKAWKANRRITPPIEANAVPSRYHRACKHLQAVRRVDRYNFVRRSDVPARC